MRPFQNLPARSRQGLRILVSGLLFALLGLGGAALSFLVLPLLRLLPGGRERLRLRAGRLIRGSFRLFVFALEASGILEVEARELPGPEQLEGALVLCNHPSYLDVVVLVALLPRALCVVKAPVYHSLCFGGLVRAAGYIPSTQLLKAGGEALRCGKTLILFPEGTRSRTGQPFKFQRGAAYLARGSGARIVPLVLTWTPDLLGRGRRWYHVPIATCRFQVRAGGPLPFEAAPMASKAPQLAARQMTEALEHYYDKEIHAPH